MVVELLKSLYGDDYLNIVLKLIFESLFYFMASLFGGIIRELVIEKEKKLTRALGSAFITTVLLVTFGNIIKMRIGDNRLIFGFSVAIGMYAPNFKKSIKDGRLFKAIVGLFSDKLRVVLNECDKDKKKKNKSSSKNSREKIKK